MTRTIAIANQKGGTGKTTTAVSLAACLADFGRRVLLIDLDPQGNASQWLGHSDGGYSLLSVFLGQANLEDVILPSALGGADIVPTSRIFAKADLMLATEPEAHLVLKRHLAKLDTSRWDYILFDCPPSLSIITVNALVASREVLIPAEPTSLSTSGIVELAETIAKIQKTHNPSLSLTGIVLCRFDRRTRLTKEITEHLESTYGSFVLNVRIRHNIRIMEAPSFQQPITVYAPGSPAAEDYRSLAELIDTPRHGGNKGNG